MKLKLKKADILEALETERLLGSGDFVSAEGALENCHVCAAGAALRKYFDPKSEWRVLSTTLTRVTEGWMLLGNPGENEDPKLWPSVETNPLAALSVVYENAGAFESGRAAAIHFVAKEFPDEIEVTFATQEV